jgi:hypothetical protein
MPVTRSDFWRPRHPVKLVDIARSVYTRDTAFAFVAGQPYDLVSLARGSLETPANCKFGDSQSGRALKCTTGTGFETGALTFATGTRALTGGTTDQGFSMMVVLDGYAGAAGTAGNANLLCAVEQGLGIRNADDQLTFQVSSLTYTHASAVVTRNVPQVIGLTFKYGVGVEFFIGGVSVGTTAITDRSWVVPISAVGADHACSITANIRMAWAWNRMLSASEFFALAQNPQLLLRPRAPRPSSGLGAIAGGATTKTISITLVTDTDDETPRASLTGLDWAFFDENKPSDLTTPVNQGTGESTDGSGVLTLSVPDSTLSNGGVGYLIVSDTDGTTTQSPSAKVFAGPVAVTVA